MQSLPAPRIPRLLLAGFMLLVAGGLASLLLLRKLGSYPESAFPSPLFALVYLWHLLVLPSVLLLWAISTTGKFAARLICKLFPHKLPSATPLPSPKSPSNKTFLFGRRDFLGATISAAPALVSLGATSAGLATLQHFRIRKLVVPIANLPPALDGFTITQLSDTHVGRFTRGAVLEKIVSTTNALQADLIAFTGDLVNYSLEDLPAGLDLLAALRARHGVFAVEGNHDLIMDPALFRRKTSKVVPLLLNESARIPARGETLQLLGLGWRGSVSELLKANQNSGTLPILLAHHPHAFDEAFDIPLTLSGHTHGGQLMLNERLGAGPILFRYWSGLYQNANRTLVVSNGVGNWFPLRTHAPAEITHLTLRAQGEQETVSVHPLQNVSASTPL